MSFFISHRKTPEQGSVAEEQPDMKHQNNTEENQKEKTLLDAGKRYVHLARALARGYTDLYFVNIDSDDFIEYHTDDENGVLQEVRRGSDFFEGCERDVKLFVHEEDQQTFVSAMKPSFIKRVLKKKKTYTFIYRRIIGERCFYVEMTISKVEGDDHFVVLAVADVDELIKQRQKDARIAEERIIYARLHALAGNFIVVYVVDPVTDAYREFAATENYVDSFDQAKAGANFFKTVRDVAKSFNHPDDLKRFLSAFTKKRIFSEIKKNGIFTLVYRLMMNGGPRYVRMTAATVEEKEGQRLIVGLNDIDHQYRRKLREEELSRQKDILGQITTSLAEQYDTLYYIDIADNHYVEISATEDYKKLNVPTTGNDFFAISRRTIAHYVHPEDRKKATSLHYKDVMLSNLKNRPSFSSSWRLVIDGKIRHIRHTEIMSQDRKHIIVCIKNIDAEVEAEIALKEDRKKSVTFTQIAERLADHYDVIYYIDVNNFSFLEFYANKSIGESLIYKEQKDFFTACKVNAEVILYPDDRERILLFLDRDNLITQLEKRRILTEDYRMVIDGKVHFARMSVTYSSDHSHFIICVENRDEEIRKEKERLEELTLANEMARRDELTHVRNKTAYNEMAKELQNEIQSGAEPFAIAFCDINDLKTINDTEGHTAGDNYIKDACALICRTFPHSPVYRIGGDEFAVLLQNRDYEERKTLLAALRKQAEENVRLGEGAIVASGMADYIKGKDKSLEDVFNRADTQMYENKTHLKELKLLQESSSLKEKANIRVIDEERRKKLDTLFKAFSVVAEGNYLFVCDMKYDFSRWSKVAVDTYKLPSEYMYGAGDIWENHIHPDDREAYRKGINDIFSGDASGHDMQYRAKRNSGEYDVCTCRGIVIRDVSGEPDYFVGTIRNHGIQGHIDALTGLRNQYGFFDDLDSYIKRNIEIRVALFGISRFSEINEMHGYHFGNRVLQLYAREVFDRIGNRGHCYRIDGTKFAVISNTLSVDEIKDDYNRFRDYLHEEFQVDGEHILLDLHCGALSIDRFDIDSQTVYACLNYADERSKLAQLGDLVEFRDEQTEKSHQNLEMMHAIRASITRNFKGFYLLYQPVVSAESEKLIGAEALLRYKDARFGAVPPDRFIPILESDVLFPELGEWILKEALLTAKTMLKKNPAFVINVNLSYSQMAKPDFVEMIQRVLNDFKYPPEHLCLEVTERCRLLDMTLLKNVITNLRAMGVQVALDDFGTGFSAIGILKEFPVDSIKIDRSFVIDIEHDDIARQFVGNIANLAHIFNVHVCVEGIETPKMRDILREFNVSSFQGYYYGKPLPKDELFDYSKTK